MGFKDLLNKFLGEEDDGLFDDIDERDQIDDGAYSYDNSSNSNDYDDYRDSRRVQRPRKFRSVEEDPNKVVDIHTTAKLQVVLAKPEKFEDARDIADHLNEKRTVVLNLEGTNKEVARRLVDLLNGVAYANGGQLKKVANNTFIITPYNVDVSGDLIDELENTGVFF